jgi:hypothetical protein
MKKPIGGFYEALIPNDSFTYHKEAYYLTNGRACVRTIILNENMTKCYIPNYTCDAVFHPFLLENIEIEFYNINNSLEPDKLPVLEEGAFFLYINYFGIKSDMVNSLIKTYGNSLIIDNTHDFFQKREGTNWSFTSARKYFGVPDGAFLYSPKELTLNYERFEGYSNQHNIERLKGNQDIAFSYFQEFEKSLDCEIKRISIFSEKMLSLVDIENAIQKRKDNFNYLQSHLKNLNVLDLSSEIRNAPYCFPFLPLNAINKSKFYENQIFIPALWIDPTKRPEIANDFELNLAQNLLSLPIDERYDFNDLNRILEIISDYNLNLKQ